MDEEQMRRRVGLARVARVATLTAGSGSPHLVPICFALLGDDLYSVVDGTPRSTLGLRRLDNIRSDPRACLLVDHYTDDWSTLWWVRIEATVREVTASDERGKALSALRIKYPRYQAQTLSGAVLAFGIDNWNAWESAPA